MTKAEREKMLAEKLEIMQELERNLRAEGLKYIAGIDEVGRGPLAGPQKRLRAESECAIITSLMI